MPIENESYVGAERNKKPLLIGCSGGGGQITGIKGVRDFLVKDYPDLIDLIRYAPVLHKDKRESWIKNNIHTGSVAMNDLYILSPIIRTILSLTSLPLLPDSGDLKKEIDALNEKEEKTTGREYVDMLLDVFPAGYESAAVWNVLLKKDKTAELKKLINLQKESDNENYKEICLFFNNLLIHLK